MDRPVVAGQIDDERPADAGGYSFVSEELHYIEQITGMLPVHGRNQLAAVHVLQ